MSLLFLVNLFFIQGLNMADAQYRHASSTRHTDQHITAAEAPCSTVAMLCEPGEDDDEKLSGKISRFEPTSKPLHFFMGIVSFFFSPCPTGSPFRHHRPHVRCLQGVSLNQAHCSFLI